MGAGIALEFRLRYPQMYERYVEVCNQKLMQVGKLWLYKAEDRWILNFPTKKHWKNDSKVEYLRAGLQKFIETYQQKEITSIAFPLLGAKNGGIPEELSLAVMKEYLVKCDIPVEVYNYAPLASDDLYDDFKKKFLSLKIEKLVELTGLGKVYIKKIQEALGNPEINSISALASVKGIGLTSLEKSFKFVRGSSDSDSSVK